MKPFDALGKAHGRTGKRTYRLEKEIGEAIQPDIKDYQGQAANLEPRIRKLEELFRPYSVYESDVKEAVKQLKAVEGKIESALHSKQSPYQVDLETINRRIESLAHTVTAFANELSEISSTVKQISNAQKQTDSALEREFAALDQKVKFLEHPAKMVHPPCDQAAGCADAETYRADPDAHKLSSNSPQSQPSRKAPRPSAFESGRAYPASPSVNDVGRDLLNRLMQGQIIDLDITRQLATRISEKIVRYPINSPSEEQRGTDGALGGRSTVTGPLTEAYGIDGTDVGQSSSGKRTHQEGSEDGDKSHKKSRIEGRTTRPTACGATVKDSRAVSDEDMGAGSLRSMVPTTRSKTKQVVSPDTSNSDGDDEDNSHVAPPSPPPPPRRTSRAIKPTERAGDFMRTRA